MNLNWDDLRVFLAVAQAGQIARAAATLQVDPTTLGRRLRRLESELEATLFERTRDGQVLTQAGEALLEKAEAPFPRTARFCCTFVLAWPDGHEEVFEGHASGQIVWPMRGEEGHGYDPIFQPDGYDITFAEMDPAEKNRISHRADAFRKLVTLFD